MYKIKKYMIKIQYAMMWKWFNTVDKEIYVVIFIMITQLWGYIYEVVIQVGNLYLMYSVLKEFI